MSTQKLVGENALSAIASDIKTNISSVASAIVQISGNPEIAFTEGGYYNTQNSTVDLVNGLVESANYEYAIVSCSAGDKFTITGEGGNAPRLYAFVDSSSPANVLSKSEGNESVTEKLIAAPTGASKLIVNAKKVTSHPCYYGRLVKTSITEIKQLSGLIVDSTGGTAYIANKLIGTDGTESANSSYLVTDYIKVSEHSAVVFNGALAGVETGYNNIHAYDKNKNWISGIYRQTSSSGDVSITLTLPAGCEYIKIMTSTFGYYKNFILYYDLNNSIEKINQALIGDSEKIQEIKENNYTSLALFENIAVCGDSWGCGWVAVDSTRHNGISWINIMARKNGVNGNVYASAGYNTATWLSGNQGLSKLLADTAKNLYFIVLGINPEPEDTNPPTGANLGSIADCNVDYTQNANTFFGRYGRIIGNIQTHAPKAKIVCIIPVLRYNSTAQAIPQIAEFYGVPWIDAKNSAYFNTDFYKNNRQSAHPLGITYAGIANAFEELLIKKIISSPTYWKDYVGND